MSRRCNTIESVNYNDGTLPRQKINATDSIKLSRIKIQHKKFNNYHYKHKYFIQRLLILHYLGVLKLGIF